MKKNIVGFSLFLLLASCNYSQSQSLPLDSANSGLSETPQVPDEGKQDGPVDFQVVMDKVMTKSCVGCHSEAGGNRGKLNLETYANVLQAVNDIKERVGDRSMPPRRQTPLTDAQIQMLVEWIDAGAPEKIVTEPVPVPTPTPAPTSTPPVVQPPPVPPVVPPPVPAVATYEMVYKQVIQPSCLKCHSGAGSGDVNLETYQNLIQFKADVRRTIAKGSMPRKSKLTDEQKKLILDWIDAGAPEFGAKP